MTAQTSIGIIGMGWVRWSVAISTPLAAAHGYEGTVAMERNGLLRPADVLTEAVETVSRA